MSDLFTPHFAVEALQKPRFVECLISDDFDALQSLIRRSITACSSHKLSIHEQSRIVSEREVNVSDYWIRRTAHGGILA